MSDGEIIGDGVEMTSSHFRNRTLWRQLAPIDALLITLMLLMQHLFLLLECVEGMLCFEKGKELTGPCSDDYYFRGLGWEDWP